MANPALVQTGTAVITNGNSGTLSLSVTLPSAPSSSNVLIAMISVAAISGSGSITPPSGWTLYFNSGGAVNDQGMWVYFITGQTATSYTWQWATASGYAIFSGEIIEVSGVSTVSPFLSSTTAAIPTTSSTIASTAVTANLANLLPIAFAALANSGSNQVPFRAPVSFTTGWSLLSDVSYNYTAVSSSGEQTSAIGPLTTLSQSVSVTYTYSPSLSSAITNSFFLGLLQPPFPAISAVQTNASGTSAASTSLVLTYGSTPTNGNKLIAFIAQGANAVASTGPTGWTKAQSEYSTDSLELWWKDAGGSEPTTYTWTLSTSTAVGDATGYEYNNVASGSTGINQSGATTGTSTSLVTASVTPSVLHTKPVAAWSGIVTSWSALTSGWTIGTTATSTSYSCQQASQNTLTGDTSTAISASNTSASGSLRKLSIIALLAPIPPTTTSQTASSSGDISAQGKLQPSSHITQWNDLSGNSLNLTQGTSSQQPVYLSSGINALGSLQFNGSVPTSMSATMSAAPGNAAPHSIFVVGQGVAGDTGVFVDYSAYNGGSVAGISQGSPSTTAWWFGGFGYNGSPYSGGTNDGAAHLFSKIYNGTTLTGNYDGSSVVSTAVTFNLGDTTLIVGGSNTYLTGNIGEILLYSQSLSQTQYQIIEGYLAWKWGLQGNLPSGHPYHSSAPIGNPGTFGYSNFAAWYDASNASSLIFFPQAIADIQSTASKTVSASGDISKSAIRTASASGQLVIFATKTATSSADVQSVASKTSGASSDIAKTVSYTSPAIGDIQSVTTKALSSSGDIAKTTSRTVGSSGDISTTGSTTFGASGDITAATSKTLSASGDISKSATSSSNASARIQVILSNTTNAIADIQRTSSATTQASGYIAKSASTTTSAVGDISSLATKTATASADVQSAAIKTSQASADIAATTSRAITASADIQKTTTLTEGASADISASATKTATASAYIASRGSATEGAAADIQATGSRAVTATADISKSVTITETASADISATSSRTATGAADIAATTSRAITASADIQKSATITEGASADLQAKSTKTENAAATIQATGTVLSGAAATLASGSANGTLTSPAAADIQKTTVQTATSAADLSAKSALSATANADIRKTVTQTENAAAVLSTSATKPETASADIQQSAIRTITAQAEIDAGNAFTSGAHADIAATTSRAITASADLQSVSAKTTSAVADISASSVRNATSAADLASSSTRTSASAADLQARSSRPSIAFGVLQSIGKNYENAIADIAALGQRAYASLADLQAKTLAMFTSAATISAPITGTGASTQAPQVASGFVVVDNLGLGRALVIDLGGYNATGCIATLIAVPGHFDAQGKKLRLTPVAILNGGLTAVYREIAEEFAIGGEWSLQLELLLPTGLIYTSPPGQVYFPPVLETDSLDE